MSGLAFGVDVRDAVSGPLRYMLDHLEDRTGLHAAIAAEERELVRGHLLNIATTRHDTALRLGAAPSGHWAQSVEKLASSHDATAGRVQVDHPGIGRAAHDVTIEPTTGMYLTLPLIAQAYNQRARRVEGLFFVKPAGKDYALLGQRNPVAKKDRKQKAGESGDGLQREQNDHPVTWWYLLVTSIRQKQDRTLLPSDEAFAATAKSATRVYLESLWYRGAHNG